MELRAMLGIMQKQGLQLELALASKLLLAAMCSGHIKCLEMGHGRAAGRWAHQRVPDT